MVRRNLITLFGICFVFLAFGQSPHSKYFTVLAEDEVRWEVYTDYIENSQDEVVIKADSIIGFAQIEYKLQQFSKVRELCELALKLNSNLGEAHNLIGKSYVSSPKFCDKNDEGIKFLNASFVWLAMDEWEIALSKSLINKDQVLLYMEKYSLFLPPRDYFYTFFGPSLREEDEYYVGCWIQKSTHVRFLKE